MVEKICSGHITMGSQQTLPSVIKLQVDAPAAADVGERNVTPLFYDAVNGWGIWALAALCFP